MNKSNLALKRNNNPIEIPEWNYFVSELQKVFKLTKDETYHIENSITAKIIATIPYAANCREPERIAISHFDDGDEKIINEGLTILALIMIEGYNHSGLYPELSDIDYVWN